MLAILTEQRLNGFVSGLRRFPRRHIHTDRSETLCPGANCGLSILHSLLGVHAAIMRIGFSRTGNVPKCHLGLFFFSATYKIWTKPANYSQIIDDCDALVALLRPIARDKFFPTFSY